MDKGLLIATGSQNLNLNIDSKTLEACLKTINNIGGTVNMNICTGQSVNIPWGSGDWIGFLFLFGLGLVFLGILLAFVIMLIRG